MNLISEANTDGVSGDLIDDGQRWGVLRRDSRIDLETARARPLPCGRPRSAAPALALVATVHHLVAVQAADTTDLPDRVQRIVAALTQS